VFPIYDQNGELIAVHGRAIDKEFLDSPKLTRGDKSLGVFLATSDSLSAHIGAVCEGAADALALSVCGVAAIAMTGTSAPDWLFKKLAFRSIMIATDADASGDAASTKLEEELNLRAARTLRLRPQFGKDWAEVLEKKGAEKLRQHLAAFSATAPDEIKMNESWRLFKEGREEAAHFAARTIANGECREWLRAKMLESKAALFA
jgi:DNA primase